MSVTDCLAVTDVDIAREFEQLECVTMVDFWAEWCGPCHVIAPIVEEIVEEYDGRIKVAKLDVEANPDTTARFDVRSIPSILFFKNGQLVDTVVGAAPKAHLVEKIEQHLE